MIERLLSRMEPPFAGDPGDAALGPGFARELAVTARLWFRSGYAQGIGAYLNFFLLSEFIETHDRAYPPRFANMRSMARSFYQTDLFVRRVTDSGVEPSGGISNPAVRRSLRAIMHRHARLSIPPWMMTYFGFQLLEAVEHECAPVADQERRLHLAYMAKAFRIMGIPFSADRELMEEYARCVEARHAGRSADLERHARNILMIGEMLGVSSDADRITAMLPDATRVVYAPIHARVRPGPVRRRILRAAGRLLMKRALGEPREAVPWSPSPKR